MPVSQGNPLPPTPAKSDPASVQARAYEQLGSTAQINRIKSFYIALPVGGTEAAIDPLPDIAELAT